MIADRYLKGVPGEGPSLRFLRRKTQKGRKTGVGQSLSDASLVRWQTYSVVFSVGRAHICTLMYCTMVCPLPSLKSDHRSLTDNYEVSETQHLASTTFIYILGPGRGWDATQPADLACPVVHLCLIFGSYSVKSLLDLIIGRFYCAYI